MRKLVWYNLSTFESKAERLPNGFTKRYWATLFLFSKVMASRSVPEDVWVWALRWPCWWVLLLGLVFGPCLWVSLLGLVFGSRCWALSLSLAVGSRYWDLSLVLGFFWSHCLNLVDLVNIHATETTIVIFLIFCFGPVFGIFVEYDFVKSFDSLITLSQSSPSTVLSLIDGIIETDIKIK
ncbi:hypothetical protein BDF14DRAFT_1740940 [Spinellus fusiger]|nr:hypothetical protein BDF14DRAFT_1740940 [Spinellus fusiger]